MNARIKVLGISQKGKNRVREHGDTWEIEVITNQVAFSNQAGPWLRIRSTQTNEIRWMNRNNDQHFQIVKGIFSNEF